VILSGGVGTRPGPTSRTLYPKQLLPLVSDATLLQETALRVADVERLAAPLVVRAVREVGRRAQGCSSRFSRRNENP